ncbi:hypothetical protein VTN77DRAFT_5912 [Rasamsonia byssochlamydoides]|uniref:uncharacterized protein n=1 Tax=Rasamsonia byssochlamydoides TaxID=89139 RepID=UPI0037420710
MLTSSGFRHTNVKGARFASGVNFRRSIPSRSTAVDNSGGPWSPGHMADAAADALSVPLRAPCTIILLGPGLHEQGRRWPEAVGNDRGSRHSIIDNFESFIRWSTTTTRLAVTARQASLASFYRLSPPRA